MVYGPNTPANFGRSAAYMDKILKGAPRGDLPVERPAKLDFLINMKNTQALGRRIPPSVAAQVTEWVQ
jgi:putative ABC transport system substrate-binding protein